MSESLAELVGAGVIDSDLAALIGLLAERGVPLVVAARDQDAAARLRGAFTAAVLAGQPARNALAGGVVIADSFEEVLRRLGGAPTAELTDAARDLGIVLVVKDSHIETAHYVRPIERDAAGHLQRRPPALLSAWSRERGALDHFYWSITDELASRAGTDPAALETDHQARMRQLGDIVAGSGAWH